MISSVPPLLDLTLISIFPLSGVFSMAFLISPVMIFSRTSSGRCIGDDFSSALIISIYLWSKFASNSFRLFSINEERSISLISTGFFRRVWLSFLMAVSVL